MKKLAEIVRLPEVHGLLFCLFFFLIGWPILTIVADKHNETIFIYLFIVWAFNILFLLLISRNLVSENETDEQDKH